MRPPTRSVVSRRARLARGLVLVLVCAAFLGVIEAASGATGTGFQAQSYASTSAGTAGGAVTGQKPESKLWFAQGSWWATMVVPSSGAHDIYRLVSGTWVDSGVLVDSEPTTREDVLWDGSHLYVLSRTPTTSEANRLRRFTFSGGRYVLDPGFPVNVPGGGAEAATIAKDSTGTLWLTYASSDRTKKVMVAHSLGSDTSWGAAFALPFAPASGLKGDDISAIIAFTDATGPAIGVAWDNENLQSDFFAIHRDGASDSSWSVETTLSGTLQADDHMNLKTADGRVYIAVKTATTTASEPLIKLLVRSPTGDWAQYPVAPYADKNTRPIVMLDMSSRQLYIFMSKGDNPAHGIYYKQTSLDAISFSSTATPLIVGPNNETINDGTSTKQNVDSTSGIVVMASNGSSYWWNGTSTGGGTPTNTPPSASPGNVGTTAGTPVAVTLSGSDVETCELGFNVTTQPANGTIGGFSSQPCTAGSPNRDSATVVYTPDPGFSGTDSFSFQVTDGSGATSTATITVNVSGSNTPPSASDVSATTQAGDPVTVTLSGSDAETCELDFAVTQAPQHGTTGAVSNQGCNVGSPNSDTARVTYTPAAGFTGTDSFTYQVTDGSGATATATATVTVTAPGQPIAATPTSFKATTGTLTGGDVSSLAASDDVYVSVGSTTTNPQKSDWWGAFSDVPSSISTLTVSYEGASSAPCTQTIQIRNWTTSSWVTLDSRTIGTTDTTISGLTPAGSLSQYVDSSGAVKIRVSCQSSGGSYTVRGDLLTITYS